MRKFNRCMQNIRGDVWPTVGRYVDPEVDEFIFEYLAANFFIKELADNIVRESHEKD